MSPADGSVVPHVPGSGCATVSMLLLAAQVAGVGGLQLQSGASSASPNMEVLQAVEVARRRYGTAFMMMSANEAGQQQTANSTPEQEAVLDGPDAATAIMEAACPTLKGAHAGSKQSDFRVQDWVDCYTALAELYRNRGPGPADEAAKVQQLLLEKMPWLATRASAAQAKAGSSGSPSGMRGNSQAPAHPGGGAVDVGSLDGSGGMSRKEDGDLGTAAKGDAGTLVQAIQGSSEADWAYVKCARSQLQDVLGKLIHTSLSAGTTKAMTSKLLDSASRIVDDVRAGIPVQGCEEAAAGLAAASPEQPLALALVGRGTHTQALREASHYLSISKGFAARGRAYIDGEYERLRNRDMQRTEGFLARLDILEDARKLLVALEGTMSPQAHTHTASAKFSSSSRTASTGGGSARPRTTRSSKSSSRSSQRTQGRGGGQGQPRTSRQAPSPPMEDPGYWRVPLALCVAVVAGLVFAHVRSSGAPKSRERVRQRTAAKAVKTGGIVAERGPSHQSAIARRASRAWAKLVVSLRRCRRTLVPRLLQAALRYILAALHATHEHLNIAAATVHAHITQHLPARATPVATAPKPAGGKKRKQATHSRKHQPPAPAQSVAASAVPAGGAPEPAVPVEESGAEVLVALPHEGSRGSHLGQLEISCEEGEGAVSGQETRPTCSPTPYSSPAFKADGTQVFETAAPNEPPHAAVPTVEATPLAPTAEDHPVEHPLPEPATLQSQPEPVVEAAPSAPAPAPASAPASAPVSVPASAPEQIPDKAPPGLDKFLVAPLCDTGRRSSHTSDTGSVSPERAAAASSAKGSRRKPTPAPAKQHTRRRSSKAAAAPAQAPAKSAALAKPPAATAPGPTPETHSHNGPPAAIPAQPLSQEPVLWEEYSLEKFAPAAEDWGWSEAKAVKRPAKQAKPAQQPAALAAAPSRQLAARSSKPAPLQHKPPRGTGGGGGRNLFSSLAFSPSTSSLSSGPPSDAGSDDEQLAEQVACDPPRAVSPVPLRTPCEVQARAPVSAADSAPPAKPSSPIAAQPAPVQQHHQHQYQGVRAPLPRTNSLPTSEPSQATAPWRPAPQTLAHRAGGFRPHHERVASAGVATQTGWYSPSHAPPQRSQSAGFVQQVSPPAPPPAAGHFFAAKPAPLTHLQPRAHTPQPMLNASFQGHVAAQPEVTPESPGYVDWAGQSQKQMGPSPANPAWSSVAVSAPVMHRPQPLQATVSHLGSEGLEYGAAAGTAWPPLATVGAMPMPMLMNVASAHQLRSMGSQGGLELLSPIPQVQQGPGGPPMGHGGFTERAMSAPVPEPSNLAMMHQGVGMEADPKTVLMGALRWQVEYYFSVENLIKDVYLRRKMDHAGFVPLLEIMAFNRMRHMSSDAVLVTQAVQSSQHLEVHVPITQGANGEYTPQLESIKIRTRYDPLRWVLAPSP